MKVKHKRYGMGVIANVDGNIMDSKCQGIDEIRIFIEWDNKEKVIAGWYSADDPKLSFPT